jgi:lipoprotein-anchoring transpeptidase ErfK/SrfK
MREAEVSIEVDLDAQRLVLHRAGRATLDWPVSTGAKGAGECFGSGRTPRGRHVVRAKIGAGLPAGTVFVGRRPTGEVWSPGLAQSAPGRDWILSSLLWQSGTEPGRTRLREVDTMRRFIYIHGAPDDAAMGRPESPGCIRMRNEVGIALFDLVPPGCEVMIHEGGRS